MTDASRTRTRLRSLLLCLVGLSHPIAAAFEAVEHHPVPCGLSAHPCEAGSEEPHLPHDEEGPRPRRASPWRRRAGRAGRA